MRELLDVAYGAVQEGNNKTGSALVLLLSVWLWHAHVMIHLVPSQGSLPVLRLLLDFDPKHVIYLRQHIKVLATFSNPNPEPCLILEDWFILATLLHNYGHYSPYYMHIVFNPTSRQIAYSKQILGRTFYVLIEFGWSLLSQRNSLLWEKII
jgi:hypothetical protein